MKRILFSTLILIVLLAIPTIAFAQTPVPPTPPDFGSLAAAALALLTGLVGFPAALGGILALANKLFPTVVTASVSSWISFAANAVMFGVIGYLVFTGQSSLVGNIDSAFAGLAKLVADIAIIIGGLTINVASVPFYAKHARQHVARMKLALA